MPKRKRDPERTKVRKARVLDKPAASGTEHVTSDVDETGALGGGGIEVTNDLTKSAKVPRTLEALRDNPAKKTKNLKSTEAQAQTQTVAAPIKTAAGTTTTSTVVTTTQNDTSSTTSSSTSSPPPSTTQHNPRSKKPARFILFIGNLPYTSTPAQLSHFFSSLQPTSIRHPLNRATGKSRGFAFVEFEGYDRMKTCVKKFHHALFPAEESKGEGEQDGTERNENGNGEDEEAGEYGKKKNKKARKARDDGRRRINVELTAGGGGGKSVARKAKLKAKNEKLAAERTREAKKSKLRSKTKEKEKEKESKKDNEEKERVSLGEKNAEGILEVDATNGVGNGNGDIHPSRMARFSGKRG